MDRTLQNILIDEKGENFSYTPINGGGRVLKVPERRSRKEHALNLTTQMNKANECALNETQNVVATSARDGIYLQIKGKEGYDLITKSLENENQNVRLLNVKKEDDVIKAAVYVPSGKENFFLKKINKYADTEKGSDVIATIEEITNATVEALWIGKKDSIPKENKQWCEIWLRYNIKESVEKVIGKFKYVCQQLCIKIKDNKIVFPERAVVVVQANFSDLRNLMLSCDNLAEIRKMVSPNDFFPYQSAYEQREWVDDLAERIDVTQQSDTSICLLDTGVNNAHPLLKKVIKDSNMYTTNPRRGVDDRYGHGTEMAGVATFFDLQEKLESMSVVEIYHYLESVKILDKSGDNKKELYGSITQQAAYLAEIGNPNANRTYCMAVTSSESEEVGHGEPTSWSAAIDDLLAGTGNNLNDDKKRLMCISAGNNSVEEIAETNDYLTSIKFHSVENPGQSWNAITVGAYTDKIFIDLDKYKGYSPVAEQGGASPFTSSSITWESKWPIKPDVVFEGGNLGYTSDEKLNGGYSEVDDLSLLTTSHDFMLNKPLSTFNMTSSATAQAAWMLANIEHYCPSLWPETVRALLIHSANWTDEMLRQFIPQNPKRKDYKNLIRIFGYGVPDLDRAVYSARSSVNMIIEDELQPFKKKTNTVVSNEMHLHDIPWPKDILEDLGETIVRMRVTLSYYIEPSPGEIGWKDKYKYPSCGLIFDVNNPTESKEQFVKRISQAMRDGDNDDNIVANDSNRWLIGPGNRNVGSIHSDIWEGPAIDLSYSHFIMVYPVTGWWKTRANHKKYNNKIRYSLIVSIETPENDVDLYTEITNTIKTRNAVKTQIKN